MREPEGYRQILEWLTVQTGGKGWLTVADISRTLHMDRETVKRRFGVPGGGCALPALAMKMAQQSKIERSNFQ